MALWMLSRPLIAALSFLESDGSGQSWHGKEVSQKSNNMRILVKTLLFTAVLRISMAQTDWPIYGHDPGGLQYSPLNQINSKNVAKLQVAWTYDVRPPVTPPA